MWCLSHAGNQEAFPHRISVYLHRNCVPSDCAVVSLPKPPISAQHTNGLWTPSKITQILSVSLTLQPPHSCDETHRGETQNPHTAQTQQQNLPNPPGVSKTRLKSRTFCIFGLVTTVGIFFFCEIRMFELLWNPQQGSPEATKGLEALGGHSSRKSWFSCH